MRARLLIALALLAFSHGATAQDLALARSLAATCFNCHGTDGHAVGNTVAPLAGSAKEFISTQMRLFREGKRPATVMQQLARGYSEAQVEMIAGYFAAQPRK